MALASGGSGAQVDVQLDKSYVVVSSRGDDETATPED